MMGTDAPRVRKEISARSEPLGVARKGKKPMKRKIESMAVAAHNSAALLALPDCVFLQENGRCSRLNREACAGEDCSFLTTHERSDQGRYKWASRLSALSEARQSEIAKKYYGGTKPWKNESR